ncbi:MAG: serine/threonine-protein kinase [Phycisphaerae bacterium]|nr:serine/threonine-protein kinase [Phycisphaerae bacterium]
MSPAPERVQEVLDLALERPEGERAAFVDGLCGEDRALRAEVVSLLEALARGPEFLEPPAVTPAPEPEPLTGLAVGPYHVRERVGEGGMGVVYRAEDTRLGRSVAVKALPPSLASDPHRLARFEHEARVLAALNHPNIAGIYGVEETARGPVLVLEFVAGETLAQRLARGRLEIDEAVGIACQIARGLEAAHAAGIVHRDLKPANVQLGPSGEVKLLDFGIATHAGSGHTRGPQDTEPGRVVGTAAYMSPEQARGRAVDRRADLWALGCVLFEMLAGRRAFDGPMASDTIASVLRAEPDWASLPPDLPAGVRRVLRRCLEKDVDRRQRDAGDVVLDLLDRGQTPAPDREMRTARAIWRGIAAGVAMLGVGVVAGSLLFRSVAPATITRFHLDVDPHQAIAVWPEGGMAISPDGRSIVFAGGPADRRRLFLRRLDASRIVELPGTDDAAEPCVSPDGRWIAFRVHASLRRAPIDGGGAEVLVPAGVASSGTAWDERGILYCGVSPRGVHRVVPGSTSEVVVPFGESPDETLSYPEPLPGGEALLVTVVTFRGDAFSPSVEALRVRTGERRIVVPNASGARFFPPDRLAFWQAGALRVAPFDARRLRLTDAPAVVQPLEGGEHSQPPRFALSRAGVLATLPGGIRYDFSRLAWLEPNGRWTEIAEASPGIDAPRLSPDRSRVALLAGRDSGDLYVLDLQRSTRLRLTTGYCSHHPVWEPDGTAVIVTIAPQGEPTRLVRVALESAQRQTLWEGGWANATDVARDGTIILSLITDDRGAADLFALDRDGTPPRRLLPPPGHRFGARLSPDGTMIAYTSEETGATEVYLHPYPAMQPKVPVSVLGGYRPVWSGDGSTLFYRYLDRLMAVDVRTADGTVTVSTPRVMATGLPDARYDTDRSGERFLLPKPPGETGLQTRIDITVGWNPARP